MTGPTDDNEVTQRAATVLSSHSHATLVLEVPSERIVATSPSAARLLADGGPRDPVGHSFEEFTVDSPSGALELFASGRLTAYEAERVLRRRDGADLPVTMWVRVFDHEPPSRYALLALNSIGRDGTRRRSREGDVPVTAVLGTAVGDSFVVERLSAEAEEVFGRSPDDILGRPLLDFLTPHGVTALRAGVRAASERRRGVTVSITLPRGEARADAQPTAELTCEAIVLPVLPGSAFVFALVPEQAGGRTPDSVAGVFDRLLVTARLAGLGRGVTGSLTEREVPGISRLTTRELDITDRLVAGDRVPAIAKDLFLTQSTVRNHLSSIFAKVGVASQQELITLMRTGSQR